LTRPAAVPKLIPVEITGPAGFLEGLLQERAGPRETPHAPDFIALVCHPHPLYGGTLHNKVVHRAAAVLHELGGSVLRINFRGVGKSDGRFDRGAGELEDARIALRWLARRHPGARRWVGGFSFGSWVAARLAASEPSVAQAILIAPPVATESFDALHSCAVPKLVLQGTADDVCTPAALEAEYPNWAEPKQLVWIEGASHFFDRRLGPLAVALRDSLAEAAR
jgi:alpha/beta superfamily hydrolase